MQWRFWLALSLAALAREASLATAGEFGEPVDREFKATIDDTAQRYVELAPKDLNPQQPVDLLIALHGHGSDRWQYVRDPRGECRGVRDVAARRRMVFISPDYRASTSWMGPHAEADLVQLIAVLRERYKVRRVFLAGGSMGGTSALIFAALHPDLVGGVLAENGTANLLEYGNFQEAIAASYGGNKAEKPDEYKKRSPELTPERFRMPLALTVGGKDTLVPPESVRRLAARLKASGKRNLLLIDHQDGGHETNYEDTVTAMEFVIRAADAM